MSNTSCVIYYFLPFFYNDVAIKEIQTAKRYVMRFLLCDFCCAFANKRVRTKGQMECKIPRHSLLMLKKNRNNTNDIIFFGYSFSCRERIFLQLNLLKLQQKSKQMHTTTLFTPAIKCKDMFVKISTIQYGTNSTVKWSRS